MKKEEQPDLLAQIRGGMSLKKSSDREEEKAPEVAGSSIVSALEMIRANVGSSSDDSSDDDWSDDD